jgi:hypothetical protein
MPSKTKSKSENKTVAEKAPKILSPKRLMEQDHLQGKHKEAVGNCEFCARRASRSIKKLEKTKRYLAANQSK